MVDYQQLREMLPISFVLNHYKANQLKPIGNSLRQKCPIHKGDNKTSFSIDARKNSWTCYAGCGRGDSISLIAKIENIPYREAAELASSWLGIKYQAKKLFNPDGSLNFQLNLNPEHEYLKKRGLEKKTIEYFGLGYCKHGIFKDMIAIPLHNSEGKLVAYLGRRIDNNEPRYKFPKGF